jgi:large subunit ribosomal protein L29
MKTRELREKGIPELEKILAEKMESARKMRFDISTKQVKNNRQLRQDKKDIAKILTLINPKSSSGN